MSIHALDGVGDGVGTAVGAGVDHEVGAGPVVGYHKSFQSMIQGSSPTNRIIMLLFVLFCILTFMYIYD